MNSYPCRGREDERASPEALDLSASHDVERASGKSGGSIPVVLFLGHKEAFGECERDQGPDAEVLRQVTCVREGGIRLIEVTLQEVRDPDRVQHGGPIRARRAEPV